MRPRWTLRSPCCLFGCLCRCLGPGFCPTRFWRFTPRRAFTEMFLRTFERDWLRERRLALAGPCWFMRIFARFTRLFDRFMRFCDRFKRLFERFKRTGCAWRWRDAERPRRFCMEFERVKLTRLRLADRPLDLEAARSPIWLFRRSLGLPRTPSWFVKFIVELERVRRRTRLTFFMRSALMLLFVWKNWRPEIKMHLDWFNRKTLKTISLEPISMSRKWTERLSSAV